MYCEIIERFFGSFGNFIPCGFKNSESVSKTRSFKGIFLTNSCFFSLYVMSPSNPKKYCFGLQSQEGLDPVRSSGKQRE